MKFYRAIIFTYPHAELLIEGKKHMNVRAKKFKNVLNKNLLMVENKEAYGIIRLTSMIPIDSLKKFNELYDSHKISDNERKSWWHYNPSKKHVFYGYNIEIVKLFDKPKSVDWVPGPRIFIKPENLKFL